MRREEWNRDKKYRVTGGGPGPGIRVSLSGGRADRGFLPLLTWYSLPPPSSVLYLLLFIPLVVPLFYFLNVGILICKFSISIYLEEN